MVSAVESAMRAGTLSDLWARICDGVQECRVPVGALSTSAISTVLVEVRFSNTATAKACESSNLPVQAKEYVFCLAPPKVPKSNVPSSLEVGSKSPLSECCQFELLPKLGIASTISQD